MRPDLKNSIFKTLSYFDLMNYPLTREELFCNLWEPPKISCDDFCEQLENLTDNDEFEYSGSFYFLRGREELVKLRNERMINSELCLKTAVRAARKIRSVPFLKAIFVCNSVGAGMASQSSDIDFLIVTDVRRVWIVRFFANLVLRILGLRTYKNKRADRICLSFFVDSRNLDMSKWRVAEDDIHFAYWLHQMVPIYDPQNLHERFIEVNQWTQKYLPNIKISFDYVFKVNDSKITRVWKNIWQKFWAGPYGDLIEKQAREAQLVKLKWRLKDKINSRDKDVILGDGVIKLHEGDTRLRWLQLWRDACDKNL